MGKRSVVFIAHPPGKVECPRAWRWDSPTMHFPWLPGGWGRLWRKLLSGAPRGPWSWLKWFFWQYWLVSRSHIKWLLSKYLLETQTSFYQKNYLRSFPSWNDELQASMISQKEVILMLFCSLFLRLKSDHKAEFLRLGALLKITEGMIMPHQGSSRESSVFSPPLCWRLEVDLQKCSYFKV